MLEGRADNLYRNSRHSAAGVERAFLPAMTAFLRAFRLAQRCRHERRHGRPEARSTVGVTGAVIEGWSDSVLTRRCCLSHHEG
jgi:hypothetical protein